MKRSLLVFNFLLFTSLAFCQQDYAGSGRALLFDGIDDYIEMGNIYDDIALPVTMTFWIYIDPSAGSAPLPILDSQNGLPAYNGFTMQVTTYPNIGITYGDGLGGNNPAFRSSKSGDVISLTGRWVHIAGIMRGHGDMDIYFNGHNVGGSYAGTTTSPMNSNSPAETMQVGYYFGNGIKYYFEGKMDELRIWKKVLTEEEIRRDMCRVLTGNEAGLIGYWNFDETSGNVVKDKSTNHFNGELKGNLQRVYSGAPIGNESTYLYPGSWSGATLALDDLSIENISGSPYGAHLYKVTTEPSQTNGLPAVTKNTYYGIFLAEDPGGKKFDFKFGTGSNCAYYTRKDNSESTWTKSNAQTDLSDRIELLPISTATNFEVSLGPDRTLCDQSSVQLTPQLSADPAGKSFSWSTGQTTPTITVNQSGKYRIKVAEGCTIAEDSVVIFFSSVPPYFSLGNDEVLCRNEDRVLKPKDLHDPSFEFTWQDGSSEDSIQVTGFGWYWLEVKNACGTKQDSVKFSKFNFDPRSIPNVITPNEDSFNDYFVLDSMLESSTLYIINRYGKKVFESSSYENDWNGHGLPSGIYYYRLSGGCIGELKGAIHLIR